MSWLIETEQTWVHRFACRVLKSGPIPCHMAFIMDGNRRFARKAGLNTTQEGHLKGFDKLAKTLEWCRELGITEVTVYAFSIENFKRSSAEVDGIMDLAREKFRDLLNDKEKIRQHGVKFQFFGNLKLLPVDIQELLAEITLFSKDFDKARLNVCIAYTAQDEMTRAVIEIAKGVKEGLLEPGDVCEDLISKCLDTCDSPDPDLVIRTSGELRLSDFLSWQCSHSCVYFDDVLWPEFSFRNLCYAILHFQRNHDKIRAFNTERRKHLCLDEDELNKDRIMTFLAKIKEEKCKT